jgi:uncharacterized protein (DUF58 family)
MSGRQASLAPRALPLLLVVVSVGVVGTIAPAWLFVFGFLLLFFGVALVADRFSLPGAGSCRFRITTPVYVCLGEEEDVRLHGVVTGEQIPTRIFLAPPVQLSVEHSQLSVDAAAGRVSTVFRVKGRSLGYGSITSVSTLTPSRLGLWNLLDRVAVPANGMRVLPQRLQMPANRYQEMISRQLTAARGDRRVIKSASPDMYHSSRPYRYPDSLRFIDRKKSARYDQLFTKTFEQILEHHVVVALDLGRLTVGTIDGSAKHDFYLSTALALIEHGVRSRDAVSLVAFSDRVHATVSRARGRTHFQELYRGGGAFQAREVASNYEEMVQAVLKVAPQRSIVILLTDVGLPSAHDGVVRAFQILSQRHLCVVLSMLEDGFDLTSRILAQTEGRLEEDEHSSLLYAYWLDDAFRGFSRRVAANSGVVVQIPQKYWIDASVKVFETLRHSLNI